MKLPKWKYYLKKFLIWRVKHITEKQFIYLLSGIVGFTSGIGAVLLKNTTHFIQQLLEGKLINEYHTTFYFVTPIIGISIVWLVMKYIIKHEISHGIPSTLNALSNRKGFMKQYQMIGSILTAPITVGFGGSVGLEGPTVATGAAVSSNIARLLHINQKNRNLLIGAAAAGAMSSIFKAPITAIVFAVEVFSLDLTILSLLPLLIASLSAIVTSYFFFGDQILLPFDLVDAFTINEFPYYVVLGLVAGLTSIYFTTVYDRIHKFFAKIKSKSKRLLIGGVAIGVIVYIFPPLYGEGFEVINNLLEGNTEAVISYSIFEELENHVWGVILLLLGIGLFKIIASSITFGAGGVGGIFAPTLFMGSVMGHVVAKAINSLGLSHTVSESNFTLVGMSGLLAGVLHAPLTAIFLIAEITGGYELFIPLMITATLGYSITKLAHPHSVYTMELGRKGELLTHDKDHAVLTLMDINSVIETNFVSVYPNMKLGEMLNEAVVKSSRNIFPVVHKKTGELLGIVLLDDIRPVMFQQDQYETTYVRDYMHAAPDVIDVDKDKMTAIMNKFQDSSAWNLPLIKNGKYYGFISKSKLLTAYRRKLIHMTR